MDDGQLKWVDADSNVTPDSGVTVGASSIRTAGPQVRAAARRRSRRCSALAAASLGVPVASLSVKDGVVSGGGKTVTYGALIGDKLFNAHDGRGEPQPRASRRAKPVGAVQARRHEPAADRHPGQGDRQVHLRPQRPRARHAPRPRRAAARPGLLRRRHEAAVGRPELDQEHPGRPGRAEERLHRGRRSDKEYDAIRAAAQLKVTWDETAKLPASGNLFGAMRDVQTEDRVRSRAATSAPRSRRRRRCVLGDATRSSGRCTA